MERKRRRRVWVNQTPENFYFNEKYPRPDDSINLTVSEFEAMRLKHHTKFNQVEAAEKMGISQPTFSRILEGAHEKVTKALMEGKTIKVFGGKFDFKVIFKGYGCLECNYEWEDKSASKEKKVNCPKCNSEKVYYLEKRPI